MIFAVDYFDKLYNLRYYFFKNLPEVFYPCILKYYYAQRFSRKLNLKSPKRFSEKILWSILYDKNQMKTILSDRLKAKEYVVKLLPSLKTAKVYQVCSSFESLDFSKCPESFVIKTNHAWKSHVYIENKNKITAEDYEQYKKYYKKVLGINYAYWGTPELQYKNIEPQIYTEEFLGTKNETSIIKEYEVYCFNGKPEFINYSISGSGAPDVSKKSDSLFSSMFDCNWKKADFFIRFDSNIKSPDSKNKDLILYYAEKLSYEFKFVRIDFFEFGGELYFGEFTFSPYSGFIKFCPDKYDLFYGEKIVI